MGRPFRPTTEDNASLCSYRREGPAEFWWSDRKVLSDPYPCGVPRRSTGRGEQSELRTNAGPSGTVYQEPAALAAMRGTSMSRSSTSRSSTSRSSTSRSSLGARAAAAVTGTVLALGLPAALALNPAQAAAGDRDGDGIPNRWERNHGMNPRNAADARADFDRDGLTNLREYRLKTQIRDEDTDNDGHDDGDEVKDGYGSTHVKIADTDRDGIRDGDEDADRDGIDNEDEDDAQETCRYDDDDRDSDDVSDEDENELGTLVRVADSNGNNVADGEEDADEDGEANEDEDDHDGDRCDGDHDGDGRDDEDEGDRFGSVVSFDGSTGVLTLQSVTGHTLSLAVTEDTEIEIEGGRPAPDAASDESDEEGEEQEDREGTTADLLPGAEVAEIGIDDETGTLEEITLYA